MDEQNGARILTARKRRDEARRTVDPKAVESVGKKTSSEKTMRLLQIIK